MKHIEGSFKGAGGLSLYYQSWHPQHQGREQGVQHLYSPLIQAAFSTWEEAVLPELGYNDVIE